MPIDPKIKDAIEEAAEELGQGKRVAQKICSWFDHVSSGKESIENKDEERAKAIKKIVGPHDNK